MKQQQKSEKESRSRSRTSTGSASELSGFPLSSETGVKLPAILQLRPYQQRWIDDRTRFKGAVKSARIGFSFATAGEAVLDCIEHPGTTWTVLSHSKSGSQEFIEKGCAPIIEAMSAVAQVSQELFADELGATDIQVTRE